LCFQPFRQGGGNAFLKNRHAGVQTPCESVCLRRGSDGVQEPLRGVDERAFRSFGVSEEKLNRGRKNKQTEVVPLRKDYDSVREESGGANLVGGAGL